MTSKSDFTAEEWQKLLASPFLAGMAVTIAEPSGLIGMIQEGWASARSTLDAKSDPNASPLAKAIVEDLESSEARSSAQQFMKEQLKGKSAIEIKPQIMGALSSAADLIDRKAGADAVGFKSWLKSTAQSVAEAAKEGGFLGFGGVAVSEAEKASIDEVARSLRI